MTADQRRRLLTGAAMVAAGLVVLVVSGLIARNGRVGPLERSVFHTVNDLPSWLYRPMWVFQQVGNLVVALLLVLVVAAVLRNPWLAGAVVLAVVAKLGLERVVKSVVERRRPGTAIGDVIFRGEVPQQGLSFVSGHAVITTAMAVPLMAVLPVRWRPLPWVLVGLNRLGRIYVGAHNPLDIVGGTALGLVIGGVLYAGLVVLRPGARSGRGATGSCCSCPGPLRRAWKRSSTRQGVNRCRGRSATAVSARRANVVFAVPG